MAARRTGAMRFSCSDGALVFHGLGVHGTRDIDMVRAIMRNCNGRSGGPGNMLARLEFTPP